jgi:hypothetical protein
MERIYGGNRSVRERIIHFRKASLTDFLFDGLHGKIHFAITRENLCQGVIEDVLKKNDRRIPAPGNKDIQDMEGGRTGFRIRKDSTGKERKNLIGKRKEFFHNTFPVLRSVQRFGQI